MSLCCYHDIDKIRRFRQSSSQRALALTCHNFEFITLQMAPKNWQEMQDWADANYGFTRIRPFDHPDHDYDQLREYVKKRNLRSTVIRTLHPQRDTLQQWEIPQEHFDYIPVNDVTASFVTEVKWIDTPEQLDVMLDHLLAHKKASSAFAVDLEMSRHQSYYGNPPALMQFGTWSFDYIVDPLPLWSYLGDPKGKFKKVMESADHLKIMHGSHNDLRALQIFFDIYPAAVIDTQLAFKELNPKLDMISMKSFAENYIKGDYTINKVGQAADFNFRGHNGKLHPDLLRYARYDVQLILKGWHNYKRIVRHYRDHEDPNIEARISTACRAHFLKTHQPTPRSQYKELFPRGTVKEDDVRFSKIVHEWRDTVARECDVIPEKIIPDWRLKEIVKKYRVPVHSDLRWTSMARTPKDTVWFRVANGEQMHRPVSRNNKSVVNNAGKKDPGNWLLGTMVRVRARSEITVVPLTPGPNPNLETFPRKLTGRKTVETGRMIARIAETGRMIARIRKISFGTLRTIRRRRKIESRPSP